MTVIVYTDGACRHLDKATTGKWDPQAKRFPPSQESYGLGGWAWYVHDRLWDSGAVRDTTSNVMEMTAVCEALESLAQREDTRHERLLVVSDSAYVVNCFADQWFVRWEQNGWKNSNGNDVKHRALWERMFKAYHAHSNTVTFRHMRGHGRGGPGDGPYVDGNAQADRLAVAARLTLERP